MALEPERGFVPDLGAIDEDVARKAKLMYLNYPNNPTGAVVPEGFFERGGRVRARVRHPRRARQRLLGDRLRRLQGAVVPRDARRQGRRHRGLLALQGLQHDRLALRRASSATPRRSQTYWRLKTNIDSGLFEAVQLAGVAALSPDADAEVASMVELYRRRRDLVCDALHEIGVDVRTPHATIYVWAPVPEGFESSAAYCRARARGGRRRDLARRHLRPGRRGLVSDLADHARRAPARGRAAARQARPR